jgi:hypothetical protein
MFPSKGDQSYYNFLAKPGFRRNRDQARLVVMQRFAAHDNFVTQLFVSGAGTFLPRRTYQSVVDCALRKESSRA